MNSAIFTRRQVLRTMSGVATTGCAAPAYAWTDAVAGALAPRSVGQLGTAVERAIDLEIDSFPRVLNGRTGKAVAVNRSIPGPLVRLREGQEAVLRVNNRLAEISSIHWHGLILPQPMDGVPGVTFGGIPAGGRFTYRFPVRQSGTYWAHSHSGGQELLGLYFPLIIDPLEPKPFRYDRDYVSCSRTGVSSPRPGSSPS